MSEVANISLRLKELAIDFILSVMQPPNVKVVGVNSSDYLRATITAKDKRLDINGALAYIKIKELEIKEIYTFDAVFEKLRDIRLVKM